MESDEQVELSPPKTKTDKNKKKLKGSGGSGVTHVMVEKPKFKATTLPGQTHSSRTGKEDLNDFNF